MSTTTARTHGESYRDAPMMRPAAVAAAARYLENEYGSWGYQIAFAGFWNEPSNHDVWHVFQCKSSDGSRFLIRADAFENVSEFSSSDEMLQVADDLNVECHAR